MLPVIFHTVATLEACEAADWYEKEEPGTGLKFERAMEITIERIRQNPLQFAIEYRNERFAFLDRFPYTVIFEVQPDQIWVSCVTHHKRRPGHWRSRKPE